MAALCVLAASPVHAQEWPTRTLTMINPFAPGGPNDVPARLFAQRMGEILGQSVIVENVGGAGGMNGADRVAKAQPDGYTFLPGVPTAKEQGYDVKAYTWNAFFLPKGVPDAIVSKLNHAMLETMKTPAVREKLDAVGLKLVSEERATPAYLDRFVQSEIAKWAELIKASGIGID